MKKIENVIILVFLGLVAYFLISEFYSPTARLERAAHKFTKANFGQQGAVYVTSEGAYFQHRGDFNLTNNAYFQYRIDSKEKKYSRQYLYLRWKGEEKYHELTLMRTIVRTKLGSTKLRWEYKDISAKEKIKAAKIIRVAEETRK